MAYKKYGMKKRITRRKRNTRRNGTGWKNIAYKALKTAKFVAGLVNAESKFFEANLTATAQTYSGQIVPLCYPSQGVTVNQREGDSIKMKNLTMRGDIVYNGTNSETVRLIIFNDKENQATTAGDILEYVGSSLSVYSGKNPNLRYDSKILYDKAFIVDANTPIRKFDIVLKIGLHVNFSSGTNTINNNALKILIIGQNVSGSLVQFISKTTYLDN